jgi:hypothetical protein
MDGSPAALITALLRGSWRRCCPHVQLASAQLARATPLLLQSGAGALGWTRVRHTQVRATPAGRQLQQAYRFHAMRTALYERAIQRYIQALRQVRIEPILFKGWSVARLYPYPHVRPYGDVDLAVAPAQYALAEAVLGQVRTAECAVDLHRGVRWLSERRWEALYARSELVALGEVGVRILGPEDQLMLLCRHFLRHNAWRPLWLCDIAAAFEARPAAFDWQRCLGRDRQRADWVACTLGLAAQLLGAQVADTPVAERAQQLPSWLLPAVLRQWNHCLGPVQLGATVPYVAAHWRRPRDIWHRACLRWDMPIAATVACKGPMNEYPRVPFQVLLAVAHLPQWGRELGRYLAKRYASPFSNPPPTGRRPE